MFGTHQHATVIRICLEGQVLEVLRDAFRPQLCPTCELQTWTQWIKSNRPNSLKKPPLPQAIITTYGAPTGWGVTLSSISSIQTHHDTIKRYRAWTRTMSHASSNKRELVTIHKALEAFAPILHHNKWNTIQILTDNTTVCYNINHLAEADTLYYSLRRLLILTDTLNIRIFSAHIQ
jgi:ribonuclease HI